jgi:hypothetical protein
MSALDQYLGDFELGPGATTSLGEYKLTPAAAVRVFLFDEKAFVHLPGLGDVQMFPTDRRDRFDVRVLQGMGIAFERNADDDVTAVTVTLGDHTIRASRTM